MTPTEADLQPFTDGKSDQYGFNPEYLIEDDVFVDAYYLTAEQLQVFLEDTPYGRRSFLADYSESDVSTASDGSCPYPAPIANAVADTGAVAFCVCRISQ